MDIKTIILVVVLSIVAGLFMLYEYDRLMNESRLWKNLPVIFPLGSRETIFCGGITGKICPEGYRCKLDGDYPDASGHCVRRR